MLRDGEHNWVGVVDQARRDSCTGQAVRLRKQQRSPMARLEGGWLQTRLRPTLPAKHGCILAAVSPSIIAPTSRWAQRPQAKPRDLYTGDTKHKHLRDDPGSSQDCSIDTYSCKRVAVTLVQENDCKQQVQIHQGGAHRSGRAHLLLFAAKLLLHIRKSLYFFDPGIQRGRHCMANRQVCASIGSHRHKHRHLAPREVAEHIPER